MKSRGITLIELLVTLGFTIIALGAMATAFGRMIRVGPTLEASRARADAELNTKSRITNLLRHAWLSTGATTTNSFFTTNPVAPADAANGTSATNTNTNSAPVTNSSGQNGQAGGGAPELVFTALGEAPAGAALYNEDDFETANRNRGPVGGAKEYELSLNPVGNAGDKKGIFLREQDPADDDPTQGGHETLLVPDVDSLSFEFWDGTTWQQTWDTTTQTTKRLPAAVRVTYSIGDATSTVFVVRIPLSDVTTANPVVSGGA